MKKCSETPKMGVRIWSKLTYDQRVFQKTHLFKIKQNLKCNLWQEGVLLAKKVFCKKLFRDPENGGSDRVKIDLRPTGVPKKLISLKFEKKI